MQLQDVVARNDDASLVQDVIFRIAYTRVDARFEEFQTDSDDFSGNRVPGLAPNRVDGVLTLDRGPGFVELRAMDSILPIPEECIVDLVNIIDDD